ncbi:MAG: ATP-dependent helicase, partial [Paenibacillus sp.]|nr:ATP-dependent helicase [Paenibacillus sp.]
MGIRYVIGRAGSGKTHHCLDDIRDQLLQAPEGDPIILLVPEQATFQAEAALVSTPGLKGLIRAQVLSFRRLAFRVMQETGGMARIHIDDSGKAMLLHRILQQHKDQLRLFNGSAEKAGFIDNLNKLFTEFRRYGIDTSKLEHHVGKQIGLEHTSSASADKLHDLRWIYGKFEEQLKQLYVDSEDYLTLLAEQVGDTGFMSRAEVWVDGFHGFTPQEYRVLEQLMVHCKRVTITVSGDRDHEASEEPEELDLFNPTVRTLIRLKRSAEQLGVEQESALVLQADPAVRFKHSPMLAYMEANFGNRTAAPFMQAAGEYVDVSIQCAVNRRA